MSDEEGFLEMIGPTPTPYIKALGRSKPESNMFWIRFLYADLQDISSDRNDPTWEDTSSDANWYLQELTGIKSVQYHNQPASTSGTSGTSGRKTVVKPTVIKASQMITIKVSLNGNRKRVHLVQLCKDKHNKASLLMFISGRLQLCKPIEDLRKMNGSNVRVAQLRDGGHYVGYGGC